MDGLLGVKLGMAQHFRPDGRVEPVTVIRVGPCVVTQLKTASADGYDAVQVGLVGSGRRRASKPVEGRLAGGPLEGAGAPLLREFRARGSEGIEVGSRLGAEIFSPDERVRVSGLSKGKGFTGVMKRHGFHGGPKSHGSKFHRAPGAIGMCATPSRVLPGTRLPGHHGDRRVTVKNLRVVEVDAEQGLIQVRGAVPGPRGGYLEIRKG